MSARMFSRIALVATLATLATGSAGCYERVVSAKGYGADRMQVTPANVSSDGERINGYRKIEHRGLD